MLFLRRITASVVFVLALLSRGASAQTALAPTPPMGWNSWDAYGLTINEQQFRDTVHVMSTQLRPFGWSYAVIDEGWYFFNPEDRPHPDTLKYAIDSYGRYVPVGTRFPSAGTPASAMQGMPASSIETTSFKPLADFVHAQGLKFGIHVIRGIPRVSVDRNTPIEGSSFHAQDAADTSDACPWDPTSWGVRDTPAGQAWYDSILRQYAAWGVDLIKVDCIADHSYAPAEIRMIHRAIEKTGKPIVLSLSPGPTSLEHVAVVAENSQMWRISDDVWDVWSTTRPNPQTPFSQFPRLAAWAQYAKPGNWPDADMLPFGELKPAPGEGKARTSRLTPTEERTMMTLWSIARSPLILGANLTLLDDTTRSLLTNPEVIRVNQTATASREALHTGDMIAWTADLPAAVAASGKLSKKAAAAADNFTVALAVFNTGESMITLRADLEAYGLDAPSYTIKDAWTGKLVGRFTHIDNLTLQPHACILWLLHPETTPAPGKK